ncbi:hypothetical protein ACFV9C_32735 [Kribbella sp. NPDC059898]|uniref:hypothetical protein n=1 Tax=Kribbella sp. NPDC059898 TaxID=3346995 RepID=UPI00364ACD6F
MFRLGESIGAAADLLASQNSNTAIILEEQKGLVGARSEVASIAAMGARAALTRLALRGNEIDASDREVYKHVVAVMAELEFLRERGGQDIGPLGRLVTRLPKHGEDEPTRISRMAAAWQRAHEATSPGELLTRDFRSTSAQLRTVAGYLAHMARLLHAAKAAPSADLRPLVSSLREVAAAETRVTQAWRSRMSDDTGRTDSPVEPVFLYLLDALQGWLRDGDKLKPFPDVITSLTVADQARQALDELVHAAHRVAVVQEESTQWVVGAGRLYVPKPAAAVRDPEFNHRPSVWRLRHPQPYWVRATQISCFDELLSAVADVATHLADAASAGRRIAGTDDQHRPYGLDIGSTPRAAKKSPARWYQPISDNDIPPIYAEPPGLGV